MKGRSCKRKGDDFERKIAKMFDAWAKSNEFSRAWLSRGQDDRTDDLRCPPWFPFKVSCKKREGWSLDEVFRGDGGSIRKWWEEIEKKAVGTLTAPMLIFSKNHFPPMVTMEIENSGFPTMTELRDGSVITMRLDRWLEENRPEDFKK